MRKNRNSWIIEEVQFPQVVITWGNIRCRFYWQGPGKKLLVRKGGYAQVYDPANLEIPRDIFRKIYRQAYAILADRVARAQSAKKEEPSLF